MLLLFIPTIGLGTMVVCVIRLVFSVRNYRFKILQISVSVIYLILGFMMFKFMITPDDSLKMQENKQSSYISTKAPKVVKVTSKPTAKPMTTQVPKKTAVPTPTPFKFTDDEILDAIYGLDKNKCSQIPEDIAYKTLFNFYKNYIKEGNKALSTIVKTPEAFLKIYGNVNKRHTKIMKGLKKYGHIMQQTDNYLFTCNEEWLKEAKPFCTNYNYYNLYTGSEILLTPEKVWGREFKYGYHSYFDDEEILLLTNQRLSKEGRQELKVITTGKTYIYDTYNGYSKKLEVFIIPDDEEIELYEDDVKNGTPEELRKKENEAFNKIKEILGI